MRNKTFLVIFCSAICFLQGALVAQTPRDFSVLLSASYTNNPAFSITLKWNSDPNTQSIQIFKKDRDGQTFANVPDVTLDSGAQSWTDTNAVPERAYEYRVLRTLLIPAGKDSATGTPLFKQIVATGYIVAGYKAVTTSSGKALLLVDSTLATPLRIELDRYEQDVLLEGFSTKRILVKRSEAFSGKNVEDIRKIIEQENKAEPLSTVVLIGRVAVPYSGVIGPDGHSDHIGAWPADGIYGDVNGNYTDVTANNPNTSRSANNNIPGDGKYDQSGFSTSLELAVGRIDAYNLPAFSKTEVELLRDYFNRNHAYRTGEYAVRTQGIIDDNFGGYGEYFATSGWRNFSVFAGAESVKTGDYFDSYSKDYKNLWMYGCGGGTDVSAGGVGTTTDFASKPTNAIFSMLFGSYFGDYDTQNNLLRAAIFGEGGALTCVWAGRPSWYVHHMAFGESIGFSTKISQNNISVSGQNIGTYVPNIVYTQSGAQVVNTGDRGVHIALMGDPTLKAYSKPLPPASEFTATTVYPNKVLLTWKNQNNSYPLQLSRRRGNNPNYTVLQQLSPGTTTFTDSLKNDGTIVYRIQALRLDSSASGYFYQRGAIAQTSVTTTDVQNDEPFNTILQVFPQPANDIVNVRFPAHIGTIFAPITVTSIDGTVLYTSRISAEDQLQNLVLFSTAGFASGHTPLALAHIQHHLL